MSWNWDAYFYIEKNFGKKVPSTSRLEMIHVEKNDPYYRGIFIWDGGHSSKEFAVAKSLFRKRKKSK